MAMTYFIRLFDSHGQPIIGANGSTWFQVTLPSSSLTNSGGGGGAGKTTFSPLSFTFNDANVVDTKLLGMLTSGSGLGEIEVAGFNSAGPGSTPTITDDYVYTGVNVTGLGVDGGAGTDALTFSYQSTLDEHFSGKTTSTSVWSAATNSAQLDPSAVTHLSNGATQPSQAMGTNLTGADTTLEYVVKFTNSSTGQVLTNDGGLDWTAITDPTFNLSALVSSGGVGKASADPLTLTLADPSKLTVALETALEKQTGLTVEIAAYSSAGPGSRTELVQDYTFGTAKVAGETVTTPDSNAVGFSFNYGQVQDVTPTYSSNGIPGPSTIDGWDFTTDTPDTSLGHSATTTAPNTGGGPRAATYLIRFFDVHGQPITGLNGNTWFRVTLPSSSISATAGSGGGAGAGKTSFSPLSFTFNDGNTIDTKLLGMLTSGSGLQEIEVAGFTSANVGTPTITDDYVYTGAYVTGLGVDGGAGTDAVTFSYTSTEDSHFSGTTTSTSVWSAATGSALLDPSDVTHLSNGATQPALAGDLTGADDALNYVVQFTNSSGQVLTGDSGLSWSVITDPAFSLSSPLTTNGLGKASAGALTLTLSDPSKLTVALETMLEKQSGLTIEIAAYQNAGAGHTRLVQDYTFGTATVSGETVTTPGSNDVGFSFNYGQVQDLTPTYSSNGIPGPSTIDGWDFTTNSSDTSLGHSATTTAPATNAPGSPAATYLIRLFDSHGQANTGTNGSTWFKVTLPSSSLTEIGSGGGPGSGRMTFSPLSFTFNDANVLDTKLLGMLTSGSGIQEIELAGFNAGGASAPTITDDYVYTGVNVTGFGHNGGAGTDALTFSYQSTEDTHFSGTTASTSVWSATTNSQQLDPSAVTHLGQGATQPTAGDLTSADTTLDYVVKFTNSSTGQILTNDSGASWIDIAGAAFNLSAPVSNGLVGKASAGELTLTLADPSKLTVALETMLEKQTGLTIEIAAYEAAGLGGQAKLIQDFTFGTATVRDETATTPGSTEVSFGFNYGQVQDITSTYSSNGIPGPSTVSGWDFVNDIHDTNLSHTAPSSEPPCYCPGTLIATERGDVPVECLAIGDPLMTASGALRPIKWIGRRSYSGRFIMGRKDILPIGFRPGSLGDGLPRRELLISPHHAMYFEHEGRGVLIEAKDLVNGVSIAQVEHAEVVEYIHIELETHDVIIAEGALSESFVDDEGRGMFHNVHEYEELYSDEVMQPARYCAPRVEQGREVEAIRLKLTERAGLISNGPDTSALRGQIDLVRNRSIEGWAQNADHPDAPVCLDIYAHGRLIGQTLANLYREDLKAAGLGGGRHAFTFTAPDGVVFSPDAVEVRRSIDGVALLVPRFSIATARVA